MNRKGDHYMLPVQEKELDVLREVIKVIENNGLHYCAIGGTCLGAIRHQGFIPWDDDIDITLPRKEYELFRTELYKQLPYPLKKMDYDIACSHDFVFTKIHNCKTTQIEQYARQSPDRITGAFVDIFPLDGVPNGGWERKKWYLKYSILVSLNHLRRRTDMQIHKPIDLVKIMGAFILKHCVHYNYFSDIFCRFVSKYDIESCNTVQYNGYSYKDLLNHVYTKTYFIDTINSKFEDLSIRIPREYDRYLSEKYGNYMELPPEDQRGNWHNVYISDMNTPCAYYAEKIAENLKAKKIRK